MGCFADLKSSPALPFSVPLNNIYSGSEILAICQRIATKNNAVYFALGNGTVCNFAGSNATYAKYGVSTSCQSICGRDAIYHGLNCGGSSSNSVFQLSVSYPILNVKLRERHLATRHQR